MSTNNKIDQLDLEKEIKDNQKITDYEIREYPVGVIYEKYTKGLNENKSELYVPEYQRNFVWSNAQQSKFIESILLNLPIPYLFVADTGNTDGRIEIVDGSQRIRTLVNFIDNKLKLIELQKIPSANGLFFKDFSESRQLRFNRKTIRIIELTENADKEARTEIFDRLNTGGTHLNPMERRLGSKSHPFYTSFLKDMMQQYVPADKNSLFRSLCPLSEDKERRREYEELFMRFFAYSNNYLNFKHDVSNFLEEYADSTSEKDFPILKNEFQSMLAYVDKTFGKQGFRKKLTDNSVPRIRFEAIAVGVILALRKNPNLPTTQNLDWLESTEFEKHTTSHASNSSVKVKARIEYVRDKLLGKS